MTTYFLIATVGLFAFFVKGLIGTGPSTVLVALGALVIDPKQTVVLASLVNVVGGFAMIHVDPVPLSRRFWIPIAISMIIGSIVGAYALKYIPPAPFEILLGVTFLVGAFSFLGNAGPRQEIVGAPLRASIEDLVVGIFSGFCGGFVGVNAPPLVSHFGRYLDRQHLRRLLVLIFIPAAIAQSLTFTVNGLLTKQIFLWGLAIFPSMGLGIYLGNRAFGLVSESGFRRILGALLLIISARLLIRNLL